MTIRVGERTDESGEYLWPVFDDSDPEYWLCACANEKDARRLRGALPIIELWPDGGPRELADGRSILGYFPGDDQGSGWREIFYDTGAGWWAFADERKIYRMPSHYATMPEPADLTPAENEGILQGGQGGRVTCSEGGKS